MATWAAPAHAAVSAGSKAAGSTTSKGGGGMRRPRQASSCGSTCAPVTCCTMMRNVAASVLMYVVGARFDGLGRRFPARRHPPAQAGTEPTATTTPGFSAPRRSRSTLQAWARPRQRRTRQGRRRWQQRTDASSARGAARSRRGRSGARGRWRRRRRRTWTAARPGPRPRRRRRPWRPGTAKRADRGRGGGWREWGSVGCEWEWGESGDGERYKKGGGCTIRRPESASDLRRESGGGVWGPDVRCGGVDPVSLTSGQVARTPAWHARRGCVRTHLRAGPAPRVG